MCILILLRAQKKEQEKGTRLSRPPAADILRIFLLSGLKKTLRLRRIKQFLSLFPPTTAMLSVKEWVFIKIFYF